jgi:hypothetical protein
MVMKSPDLDNRWQQVAWLKQDTENFLFPYVTCNQTWLNPPMDDSKCGNVTKSRKINTAAKTRILEAYQKYTQLVIVSVR